MNKDEFSDINGRILSIEEIRKIQIDMLIKLADFCDRNQLRYYISGGTLLGAVRHKGFIPWDDDIDINMPRSDYEDLIKLSRGKIDQYEIITTAKDYDNDSLIIKVFDRKTILQETVQTLNGEVNHYTHVFIDIFPLDGLPSNHIVFLLHSLRIHILVGMYRTAINGTSGKTLLKRLIRLSMIPIAKITGADYWRRKIRFACLKYNCNESKGIGSLLSRNRFKDYNVVQDYLPYDDSLEFEGYHFHAPKSYVKHLTNLYGDYMKLPPKEKQNSGHTLVGKAIL